MSVESFKSHVKRRAGVIAERMDLEIGVGGTAAAPLERAVFKATKGNTKAPKEKHISLICRSVLDANGSTRVVELLSKRIKSSDEAGSEAAGLKALAVLHRSLNAGNNTPFVRLCHQYSHLLEPPKSLPLCIMYSTYIHEMVASWEDLGVAHHKETESEEPKIEELSQDDLVRHVPRIAKMMSKLLQCDLQGGLIDVKTRCAVQYVINLLALDSVGLFKGLYSTIGRTRSCIGMVAGNNAATKDKLYRKYTAMPEQVLQLLKQVNLSSEVAPAVAEFDQSALRSFKASVQEVVERLKTDTANNDTGATDSIESAIPEEEGTNTSKEVAEISMPDQTNQDRPAELDQNLIDFDNFTAPPASHAANLRAATALSAGEEEWNPFGNITTTSSSNPFADTNPVDGAGTNGAAFMNTGFGPPKMESSSSFAATPPKMELNSDTLSMLYSQGPNAANTMPANMGMRNMAMMRT
mmetsp:Transcript_39968/g.62359  ORF Transcript_39968/g.62359 Transcript_39968/m.62359 type:complete len:467 (-) Transcript_39968:133-1533(-)